MKKPSLTVHSLGELAQVRKALAQRAQAAAQEAARLKEEAERAHARKHLFRLAMGKVQPLKTAPVADLRPSPAAPVPKQRELDEAAALREALSDEVDISTLLDTDEHLSFRRRGVGADVTQRLRKGQWAVQAHIDLHGLRTDEARETLGRFVHDCHAQGLRCVRVVHGKGLGSPGKTPVLKDKVRKWLVQKSEVVAFVQSPPAHGGAGALLVLLQPVRAKRPTQAATNDKTGP